MSFWRQLSRGFRALTSRGAANQDVVDEVADYLERATAEHLARGLTPDDARRAARLELGSTMGVEEQVRDYGWENVMETILGDLRFAARRLRTSPGFTIVAVLTLALGVGATTAIFSAVNPILFQSLPYPDARRIVSLLELHNYGGPESKGTFAMYHEYAQRALSFDAIAVFKPWQPAMTGRAAPELLNGQQVSHGYFRVLGVAPAMGRDFQASEDLPNGPAVVILSDRLWRRRFAADRAIIGRSITLDGYDVLVIGIMPAGFENVSAPSVELWAPLQYDPSIPTNGREWGHHLGTIARLRPGITMDQATAEVNALGHALVTTQSPETYDPRTMFMARSLQDELTGGVKPALLAILAAVALLLVIACVNVTNLLLARGAGRAGEMAVRTALGAGRGRLVRQMLTESLLLALLGGVAGMAVAGLGIRALVVLSPAGLPRVGAIHLNGAVLAFGLAVTTLIGLAFGLAPALHAARSAPQDALQQGSRRTTSGHRRARGALVVAEVALALVLLVNAGLLLRSIERLFAVPSGFDASNLLTMQVQEAGPRYRKDAVRARFFAEALDAVRRVPGVTGAAWTSQLPLSGDQDQYGARLDATPSQPAVTIASFRYAVSPGYLELMHIPLKAGRLLNETDGAGTPLVAVVSASLAKDAFPQESALGQHIRLGGSYDLPPYTIVGVVGDVRQQSLALSDADAVYLPATQWRWMDNVMSLVVRSRGDAGALTEPVRQAIWSVDKDQPIVRVALMDRLVAATASERRFALILFECFALAALLLAAAGIYGVLAGSVAERTREIGVRSALGASPGDIVGLVLKQGMTLTMLGQVIGLAGAIVATGWIVTLLWNVSRLDPLTYAGVIVLLTGVAILACLVPAWRAAKVDPATTLRAE